MLIILAVKMDFVRLIGVIAVTMSAFFIVTAFRSKINAPRPYERPDINAVVPKSTTGKSCPSRHSACSLIIAIAWIYIYPPVGIVMTILAVIIAFLRPIMGVHFPLDVLFGLVLSLIIGIVGFGVIMPLVTSHLAL